MARRYGDEFDGWENEPITFEKWKYVLDALEASENEIKQLESENAQKENLIAVQKGVQYKLGNLIADLEEIDQVQVKDCEEMEEVLVTVERNTSTLMGPNGVFFAEDMMNHALEFDYGHITLMAEYEESLKIAENIRNSSPLMKELVEWEKKYKDEKEAVDQASVNLTEKKKKLAKLTKRLAAEEKRSVDFEQELSSFQKSYGKLFEKYVVDDTASVSSFSSGSPRDETPSKNVEQTKEAVEVETAEDNAKSDEVAMVQPEIIQIEKVQSSNKFISLENLEEDDEDLPSSMLKLPQFWSGPELSSEIVQSDGNELHERKISQDSMDEQLASEQKKIYHDPKVDENRFMKSSNDYARSTHSVNLSVTNQNFEEKSESPTRKDMEKGKSEPMADPGHVRNLKRSAERAKSSSTTSLYDDRDKRDGGSTNILMKNPKSPQPESLGKKSPQKPRSSDGDAEVAAPKHKLKIRENLYGHIRNDIVNIDSLNISPITGQKPSGRVASPTLKVDGAIKTNRGQVSSAKDGAVFLVPAPAKSTDGSFDVKTSPTLTADGAIKTNRGKGSPAKDDPIFLVPAPAKSADGAFKAKEKSTPSKAIAPVSPMSRSDRDIDNFSMDGTSEFGNFPDDFDDDSTLDDFDENISMISNVSSFGGNSRKSANGTNKEGADRENYRSSSPPESEFQFNFGNEEIPPFQQKMNFGAFDMTPDNEEESGFKFGKSG